MVDGLLSDGSTFNGTLTVDTGTSGFATAVDIRIVGHTNYHATKVIFQGSGGSAGWYMGLSDGNNNNTYLELTILTVPSGSSLIGYTGGPVNLGDGFNHVSKFVNNGNYGGGPYVMHASLTLCHLSFTSLTATPNVLWPPNKKLVPVNLQAVIDSNCGGTCKILNVQSSEPLDSVPDWVITGDLTLNLMADRLGSDGNGRTYTITVQCTDGSSTPVTKTVTVTVPHDHGQ